MSSKLRSACDRCHRTKVKCSGESTCQGCQAAKTQCVYSLSNTLGRPRGIHSRKKKPSSSDKVANRPTSGGNVEERRKSKQLHRNMRQSSPLSIHTAPPNSRPTSRDDPELLLDIEMTSHADLSREQTSVQPLSSDSSSSSSAADGRQNADESDEGSYLHFDDAFHSSAIETPLTSIPSNEDVDINDTMDWGKLSPNLDLQTSDFNWTSAVAPSELTKLFSSEADSLHSHPHPQSNNGLSSLLDKWSPKLTETPPTLFSFSTAPREPKNATPSVLVAPANDDCACLRKYADLIRQQRIPQSLKCKVGGADAGCNNRVTALTRSSGDLWDGKPATQQTCPYQHDQTIIRLALKATRTLADSIEQLMPSPAPAPAVQPAAPALCEHDDEKRSFLLRLLVRHTLQKVKAMLQALQESLESRRGLLVSKRAERSAGMDDYDETSNDLLHMQQTSNKLASSVQMLEEAFDEDSVRMLARSYEMARS